MTQFTNNNNSFLGGTISSLHNQKKHHGHSALFQRLFFALFLSSHLKNKTQSIPFLIFPVLKLIVIESLARSLTFEPSLWHLTLWRLLGRNTAEPHPSIRRLSTEHEEYIRKHHFTRERERKTSDKLRKEKKNLPDVLYLILRPIRIEDGVPGCAAFARRLSVMVRL